MNGNGGGQRPVHELRIGLNRAAIWRNANDQQRIWYSVSFSRSYKAGDEWKSTTSFAMGDLLEVAKLADQAHDWILDRQRNEGGPASAPGDAEPPDGASGANGPGMRGAGVASKGMGGTRRSG